MVIWEQRKSLTQESWNLNNKTAGCLDFTGVNIVIIWKQLFEKEKESRWEFTGKYQ